MKGFPPKSMKPRGNLSGRSRVIRTPDPLVPNEVRYQAALYSVAASGLARELGGLIAADAPLFKR